MSRATRFVIPLAFLGVITSCVGAPPVEDYTIAYTAIEAARSAQATKYAPGFFSQAEEYYRQALADYEDRRYQNAQDNFTRAKQFAEKAENYTVLKKANSGEGE